MLQTSKMDNKKHKPIFIDYNKKDTEAIFSTNPAMNMPWYPNLLLTTPSLQPEVINEKHGALSSPVHGG